MYWLVTVVGANRLEHCDRYIVFSSVPRNILFEMSEMFAEVGRGFYQVSVVGAMAGHLFVEISKQECGTGSTLAPPIAGRAGKHARSHPERRHRQLDHVHEYPLLMLAEMFCLCPTYQPCKSLGKSEIDSD